MTNERINYFN